MRFGLRRTPHLLVPFPPPRYLTPANFPATKN